MGVARIQSIHMVLNHLPGQLVGWQRAIFLIGRRANERDGLSHIEAQCSRWRNDLRYGWCVANFDDQCDRVRDAALVVVHKQTCAIAAVCTIDVLNGSTCIVGGCCPIAKIPVVGQRVAVWIAAVDSAEVYCERCSASDRIGSNVCCGCTIGTAGIANSANLTTSRAIVIFRAGRIVKRLCYLIGVKGHRYRC